MTDKTGNRGSEMTDETEPITGVLRRTVLKASAVAVGAVGTIGPTVADSHENGDDADDGDGTDDGKDESESETENEDDDDVDEAVDEPDGFEVEILAPHAPFPDDVAATFDLEFADVEGDPIAVELDDASTLVVAEVTWTPGGTSGWHRHPGPVLVNVVEGELEVVWERDCVPRTYAAGESFLDPGEIHTARNTDDDGCARAYAMFLGIPDGEPATIWVPPVDC